jgi:hypothetical protein
MYFHLNYLLLDVFVVVVVVVDNNLHPRKKIIAKKNEYEMNIICVCVRACVRLEISSPNNVWILLMINDDEVWRLY